jgi:hypothetical protein
VIPLEVKATERPRAEDARPIEHFMARHPGLRRRGYVICRAAHRERLDYRVIALPWQEL